MEDLILRLDIFIEGFETIKGVPIELSGCRSYELIPKDDNKIRGLVMQDRKGRRSKEILSIVVNITTQANKKIIVLESPLLISNNTEFCQHLLLTKAPELEPICVSKMERYRDCEKIDISPNGILKVPLNWLVCNKSMMYMTNYDEKKQYVSLFENLRKKVWGPHELDQNEKPIFLFETGIKFLSREGKEDFNISVDLSVFKCKPTTLNRPPQLLITFNPPISI